MSNYDFSGWATRNDLLCGDGRTIRKNAFIDNDGDTVPLVWNHDHSTPDAVLGHALLENRDEGVYAYCNFNDTESGQNAKKLVVNGDIRSLSIYANKLKQVGGDVIHGSIRELSLVHAGSNPGAFIEDVMAHGDDDAAMIINYDENALVIYHSEEPKSEKKSSNESEEDAKMPNEKTVKDVIDSMTEEQKNAMYYVVSEVLKETLDDETPDSNEDGGNEDSNKDGGNVDNNKNNNNKNNNKNNNNKSNSNKCDNKKGDDNMKHNVFDQDEVLEGSALSHSEIEAIFNDAGRYGTLKSSFFAHAGDTEHASVTQQYGINGADFLFSDAKALNVSPEFIKRDTTWVDKVMRSVHRTPFSRIKSIFADITEDDARAKGYIKGKLKKEEVFGLLKRTTTPTTIYKKQKFDRDDLVDVTDFDVIAWIKNEMRMMLDEEIARAILIGDGRESINESKINESNIRPVWTDEELYTLRYTLATAEGESKAKNFIKMAIKNRKNYKGSGNPTLYTTEDMLTDMLLIEDTTGRAIYDSVDKLKTALRVSDIITVPVMEGATRTGEASKKYAPLGIFVNLSDYNVGADKGGAVNMFDDFDIDYNQQKYLIETRCSGALIKPYSAYVIEEETVAG